MIYEQIKIKTHFCLIIGKAAQAATLIALAVFMFGGF